MKTKRRPSKGCGGGGDFKDETEWREELKEEVVESRARQESANEKRNRHCVSCARQVPADPQEKSISCVSTEDGLWSTTREHTRKLHSVPI